MLVLAMEFSRDRGARGSEAARAVDWRRHREQSAHRRAVPPENGTEEDRRLRPGPLEGSCGAERVDPNLREQPRDTNIE